ncbi:protein cordon-bleu isoform X5 [Homo sapiens]|uniref:protein cordon-bleu isoform X5 n=1 Tax=Homo sapiens TaxID=9606 RepID=UPI0005D0340E|nr:protein cordon-bleu isoform X5 [Homo sapiens]|eukprot:XP_011513539.1 protein cordon-bleu isoform X6 [Homo sapiens]
MDAPRASAAKPPTGRKMKARAPPPPGKAATLHVHSDQKPPHDGALGSQQNLVRMKEALRASTMDVTVVLPSGLEKRSVLNGSHAMMDLLVELCLQNHLNPSHHALEIRSSETQQPLSFKPNTLIGTLNVHTVFLKEKVPEEKVKPGPPKVPEKSVRLVVNYLRTQKAVVRVSPEVPLQNILPVICAKCEVSPEHVVLLRDNIAGEELELSKSLNELGIKELYAWDNRRVRLSKTQSEPSLSCQETFRKSSLGNDETDKEKKKFLGFFKVNKRSNSKAEQLVLSGADSDEDTSRAAPGRGLNGCLTTPNSPSMHSRSLTLGPSLSLGSISGVSVKSEMKKRRAPPPPGSGPPVQDKASEKVSLGSQIDLQKKKRRAPAPPPPQPPPPSPLIPNRTEDKEENRKSTMVSLPLGSGSHCSPDGAPQVLSEAEETVSVGSCFASEDTTEDSGVMSSPSDIVSLDSQQDSMKYKDKWATDQEDCSDQDLAGTPDLGPQKSPLWEKNGSENSHLRTEKAVTASNDEEDLLIAGEFRKTLAELDEDLEEMEDSYETDTSSLTSSIHGASNHCPQDAMIPHGDTDAIPVTFIGEVSDDPVDSGLFSNRNNNAGSFDSEGVASRRDSLAPLQAEHSQPHEKAREEVPALHPASHDVGKGIRVALSNISKDGNLMETAPRVTSFASNLHTDNLNAKVKDKVYGCADGERTQATERVNSQPVNEKDSNDKNAALAPTSWHQRGQNPGKSYRLKHGLTTYKIIPPKSEMRCYDRDVSLSTGAIKIDELGNLVSPHATGIRIISLSSSVPEAESQPIGKVREFWRCNSVEKHLGRPSESSARGPPSTPVPTQTQNPESRLQADPKPISPQQKSAHHEGRNPLGEGRNQPPTMGMGHVRVPAAHTTEVTFLKPQRRTSSQYVASAIAKRIGAPKVHADVVRPHGYAEKGYAGKAPVLAAPPVTVKDDRTSSPHSETQGWKDGAQWPCVTPPNNHGEDLAVGAPPRGEVIGPHRKLSTQDRPAAIHRSSCFSLVQSSQRDRVSVGQSCGFSGKQSTSSQEASSASEPRRAPDGTDPPPPHTSDTQACSRELVNGSVRAPGHGEPSHPPGGSGTESHILLEREEKPSVFSTDGNETDSIWPPSIFGPKKKFKPVVQRPVPKDTSLHSALMEAIHSAGGKDRLRKTAEHTGEGRPAKLSYTEAEGERSALLAAIRGHSGTCSLRKVASSASEELQSFRDAALSAQGSESPLLEDLGLLSPPAIPPPPPPPSQALSAPRTASRFSTGTLSNTADARQALMDAIRSGTGAARLRKVPLLV